LLWFDELRTTNYERLREAAPPLILGVALLAFLNSMNAKEWQSGGGSAYHYLITQPFVWLHYFRLFFLPVGLTADTDMPLFDHWYDTRAVAGYAFVALLVLAIWRVENRAVKFGLAWFAIALVPTSIFPLAEVANEHRIFFAYIGLVLAAAALIPRRALAAVAVIVFAAHFLGTHARNEIWRTEDTLWADTVAKSPNNGRAWMNYGLTRMSKGAYADAQSAFERAAVLTPNYWILEINRGILAGAMGDQAAAEQHFQRALRLDPDANAHYFYARWLVQRGRTAEAIPHVREAVRISPGFADALALRQRIDGPR
jgi:protein O-mannosyl-transferase